MSRGYSLKTSVGVCDPLTKTLTSFNTKICDFPYSVYDQNFDTVFMTWPKLDYLFKAWPLNQYSAISELLYN